MRLLAPVFILLFCLGASSFAVDDNETASANRNDERGLTSSPQQPLDVSLVALIAQPDLYHGHHVRVKGFYRNEFEGTGIYLHREDYEQGLAKNGLWVHRSSAEHDLSYVLIEGRFDAEMTGHLGLWSGSIDDVTRMIPWPPTRRDAP